MLIVGIKLATFSITYLCVRTNEFFYSTNREDNKRHFDALTDSVFDLETKLHAIKKMLKKGGGQDGDGGDGDTSGAGSAGAGGGLKNFIIRVESVCKRLETVQGALENCGGGVAGVGGTNGGGGTGFDTALLLAEIRKRAESESIDRLSQDFFKSIHNVQRRLLEEHVSKQLN